jgi:hypothetical protein
MSLFVIAMIVMFFLSVIVISDVSAAKNDEGTNEGLDPISVPTEKNSHSNVNMKNTGVPIVLALLSLIFSVGFLVRRD